MQDSRERTRAGITGGRSVKKQRYVPEETQNTTDAPVGGERPLPAKEGNDRRSHAGERAVGVVGAKGDPGVARGHLELRGHARPLHRRRHRTAATAIAAFAVNAVFA